MKITFLALVVTLAGAAPPVAAQSVLNWSDATLAEVQTRLDQGAGVNVRGVHGNTPLHWVAPHNANPAVMALLLDRGRRWMHGTRRARRPCTGRRITRIRR